MSTATVVREQPAPVPAQSPFILDVQKPDPFSLIIFGATGDLTARKLIPALYSLRHGKFLPKQFIIVGIGRRDKNDAVFRADMSKAIANARTLSHLDLGDLEDFLGHIFYQRADFTTDDGMKEIVRRAQNLEKEQSLPGNRLVYMATDPEYFDAIAAGAAGAKIVNQAVERPWTRVVVEKPFGHDLKSALELDRRLLSFLRPDQIYRIDHYLGKETVQNLMAFRFGNAIFEPLLNRQYVDHIQITVAETIGMEGRRGAYYDGAGAVRDMVQNHVLQLLALTAMEPPATLKASDITDSKLKVLRNIVARRVIRGQYGPGQFQGQPVKGYREEEAIAPDSKTETFAALRVELENWRWSGVPFLLRTGKRLAKHVTEIAVYFKLPPLRLFRTVECVGDFCDLTDMQPNVLVFRIQPDEGISLSFSAMRPGMNVYLHPVRFEFDYGQSFGTTLPDAYERLLLDALRGDSTLFMTSNVLEAAWEFVTPILEAWQSGPAPDFPNYVPGSWGPADADALALGCVSTWRRS